MVIEALYNIAQRKGTRTGQADSDSDSESRNLNVQSVSSSREAKCRPHLLILRTELSHCCEGENPDLKKIFFFHR